MIIKAPAGRKIPHSRLFKGEVLYFMEKGIKKITVKEKILNVLNYVKFNDEDITSIINEHNEKIAIK